MSRLLCHVVLPRKTKSTVRQQQWCHKGRWLHRLWSASAVFKSNALNPLCTLSLTSVCNLFVSFLLCDKRKLLRLVWVYFMDVLSTAILSDLRLSLASLIITTYWSTWVMSDVSYLHSLHSSESTHLYSQRPWQLYFLHPLGDDAVLLYTLLQRYLWTCVRSQRCPSGLRASPRLKRTGENAYSHCGIHSHLFHMSFSVYPSVTLSLSLLSLSLLDASMFHFLGLIPSHSVILNKDFLMSPFVLLLFVILTHWHKHSQHRRLSLYSQAWWPPSCHFRPCFKPWRTTIYCGLPEPLDSLTHLTWLAQFISLSGVGCVVWHAVSLLKIPHAQRRVQF